MSELDGQSSSESSSSDESSEDETSTWAAGEGAARAHRLCLAGAGAGAGARPARLGTCQHVWPRARAFPVRVGASPAACAPLGVSCAHPEGACAHNPACAPGRLSPAPHRARTPAPIPRTRAPCRRHALTCAAALLWGRARMPRAHYFPRDVAVVGSDRHPAAGQQPREQSDGPGQSNRVAAEGHRRQQRGKLSGAPTLAALGHRALAPAPRRARTACHPSSAGVGWTASHTRAARCFRWRLWPTTLNTYTPRRTHTNARARARAHTLLPRPAPAARRRWLKGVAARAWHAGIHCKVRPIAHLPPARPPARVVCRVQNAVQTDSTVPCRTFWFDGPVVLTFLRRFG